MTKEMAPIGRLQPQLAAVQVASIEALFILSRQSDEVAYNLLMKAQKEAEAAKSQADANCSCDSSKPEKANNHNLENSDK
jgi:hypothetical protein